MDASTVWLPEHSIRADTRLRLFCFHHAGGAASMYYRWSKQVPGSVQLLPVQLPGREQRFREPAYDDIKPLVEALGEVLPPYLDMPFVLLGQSMGALIAFELARWLRRTVRREPLGLVVASSAAPQEASHDDPIHPLPRDQFLVEIQERYGGVPKAVAQHQELMDLLLPTVRADVTVVETYCYRIEPPLACPILAIGGTEDTVVPSDELRAWKEQTTSDFSLEIIPGDHFVLDSSRQAAVPLIMRWIEALLDRGDK
jgi:medium-chain acyl-[acyl-carrier-protein] hydrolase